MRAIRPFCLVLLLSFVCTSLFAQTPVVATSPQTTQSGNSSSADYSKEPYVFELIESKIHFDKDGKGQRDLSVRVKIQSESAVREFGLLVYPYDSAFESLDVLSARVQKPDGTIVDTPQSDVQELDSAVSREAPMYTDQREKHIAIKSLSTGDILEVKLRWTIHDPIAPGYFWYDTSYFHDGICLKQVVEISVPRDVPVNLKYSSPEPSTHDDGNIRIYTFQTSNLEKPKESKIPAWEKDFYGAAPPALRLSSFPNWESVGSWYNSLQQSKLVVSPEIRARAEELTKGKSTDDEKIQAIYEFVSTRFRYIGVDLGLGRYSPHSASDVLANRYGDCKDKHTLFAALLQAEGIQAYPALISTKYRIDPTLPSISLFDHMITAIPRGDSFLFLDVTPEVAPYGLLLAALRDHQALVIPTNSPAHLVTTPADPAIPNKEFVRIEGSLDSKGTLDARFSIEEHGDAEVILRSAYRATPQNKWQELTQNLAQRMGYAGTVSDVSITPPEDTSKPLLLTFSYHRTDFPDWKNRRIGLPTPFFFLPELNEEQKLSKDPLPLGSSQDITYDATVKLPDGFTVVLPEEVTRKPAFGSFTARYTTEKPNVIHGVLHLQLSQREIPGTQRAAFDEFGKTVRETPTRYIFVKGDFPAETSTGNGLSDEQLAALEGMALANPHNGQFLSALVEQYLSNNQPERALAFLDKMQANSADPDGGVSNYLYGKTYLAMKDKEKAYTFYQKALADDPEPFILNNVAWDLNEAGMHHTEALDCSKRALDRITRKTMEASAGDAEASDFQLMPLLAASWDTLGWIYFRSDDLNTARKYLEAAWQLSLEPEKGEHLVELYLKIGESHKAAAVCSMALAGNASTETHEKLAAEWSRLKTFLKLPGGESDVKAATSQGSMSLSEIRTVKIPYHAKLQGNSRSAQVALSLTNGPRVDDVSIVSGADELRNAVADIAAAKYPMSFPDDTPARILRKATLSCSVYTKECLLILLTIQDAAVPVRN